MDGNLSTDALQAIGLSDLDVMTDEEGLAVRGEAVKFSMSAGFFNMLGLIVEGAPVVCMVKAFSFRYRRLDPA